MTAAVKAAEGENVDIPHLLMYALQHGRWGVLPEAGGLRDQPAGWLRKMAYLSAVYNGVRSYLGADNTAAWADKNPDTWEMVAWARQLARKTSNGERPA